MKSKNNETDRRSNIRKIDTLTPEQRRLIRKLARQIPGLGEILSQISSTSDYCQRYQEICLGIVQCSLREIRELEQFGAYGTPLPKNFFAFKSALEECEQKIKASKQSGQTLPPVKPD